MNRCKTCKHWQEGDGFREADMCDMRHPDTHQVMRGEYEVRICKHPSQTFAERPVERDGFGLTDASEYFAVLATAEGFGCVRHEKGER